MKTTLKKLLSLTMVLMMVVSMMAVLPLAASAEDAAATEPVAPNGTGTAEDPYVLTEPGNLVYLCQAVVETDTYYVLGNDIDMAGVTDFVSIKAADGVSIVFDGKNHAIKNLTVADGFGGDDSFWVGGLFGLLRGNDVIKNLKMEALTIKQPSGGTNTLIGGLVGQASGTSLTIQNVTVDSNSKIENAQGAKIYVGGLIGAVTGGETAVTVKDCAVDAYVDSYLHFDDTFGGGYIGQYAGKSTLTFQNCTRSGETKGRYAAGYVATTSDATAIKITNCSSTGNVTGNGRDKCAAGFMAYVAGTSTNVTVEKSVAAIESVYVAYGRVAGFFGWFNGIGNVTMTDCVNSSHANTSYDSSSAGVAGGFVARLDKPLSVTMSRCLNTGTIGKTDMGTGYTAGGFIAILTNNVSTIRNIKMEYCLNKGSVYGSYGAGGLIGQACDSTTYSAALNFEFKNCGNVGELKAFKVDSHKDYGRNAMGGLIGTIYNDKAEGVTFTAENCFNSGKMTMPVAKTDNGGFGGLVGHFGYKLTGNTVTFKNCYTNPTVTANSKFTYGDFYGVEAYADVANQTITVDTTCVAGADAAEAIAALNIAISCNGLGMHTYTDDCDVNCNDCGATRVAPHTNSNPCASTCTQCSESRVAPHVYDNECDTICNACDAEREAPHAYDNGCDGDCNKCDVTRTPEAHVYTADCDADCNVCGEVRTAPRRHTYDDGKLFCDSDCNVCGELRVAPHSYDDVCLDTKCKACEEESEAPGHLYDDACDATCNVCNQKRTDNHVYNDACDKTCNLCGAERNPNNHEYDHDCDKSCSICGEWREVGEHVYDNACDNTCNNCGFIRTAPHTYTNACDDTCDGTDCGATRIPADHVYANACDTTCDVCGATREVGAHNFSDGANICRNCGVKDPNFTVDNTTDDGATDTTPADTTAPADTTTAAPEEEEKGCHSTINGAYAALAIVAVLGFAFVAKKREEN